MSRRCSSTSRIPPLIKTERRFITQAPRVAPPTLSCSCRVHKMRSVARHLKLQLHVTNYEWLQWLLFTQHQQIILWLSNSSSSPPSPPPPPPLSHPEPEVLGVDIDVLDEEMLSDVRYNARMQQQYGRQGILISTVFAKSLLKSLAARCSPRRLCSKTCACVLCTACLCFASSGIS